MHPFSSPEMEAPMKVKPGDTMWCVVMFDLPVQTAQERRESSSFRKLLLDCGFSMIQFSVYAKYSPTIQSNTAIEKAIRASLPANGEVRIFHLTDKQWASATRIIARQQEAVEAPPSQLTLF